MSNILNTLNTQNTNVIPARKLTKGSTKGNFVIDTPPPPLYKYSLYDILEERKRNNFQIRDEVIKKMNKKDKKRDYGFLAILSGITALAVFFHKKI